MTVNDFTHLISLLPVDTVDFIIDGCNITRLVINAKDKKQVYKKDNTSQLCTGYTQAGEHLLFTCIDNEPKDKKSEWVLESTFLCLLENGFDPNEIH